MSSKKSHRKKSASPPVRPEGGIVLALLSGFLLEGCSTLYGASAGVGGASEMAEDASGETGASSDILPSAPLIQGRAINGYLVNGLVFQDINRDGLLSANENLTLTDASGNFTLPGTSSGDLIVKPINLLSDIEKSNAQVQLRSMGVLNPDILTTYYLNSSGTRTDFKGQLEMAASMVGASVNITPLTTMVNGLLASGQFDLADANQKVASLFGMPVTTDYVAMASSGTAGDADVGEALQKKAVALSNLLTSALQFYEASLSKQEVLELLALKVLTKLEEVKNSPLTDLDISDYLASSSDIKSILLEIGAENDFEVDLSKLDTFVESLVSLNQLFVESGSVRLVHDTGVSGVDHITSDWQFSLPDVRPGSTAYVYGVTDRWVGQDDVWLPDSWYESPQSLALMQGVNTIFIKPLEGGIDDVMRLTLNYDNVKPQLNSLTGSKPLEVVRSPYFVADDVQHVSDLLIASDFFINRESDGASVLPQYQLVRADATGALAPALESLWLPFPNMSAQERVNGTDMRLYYRQMDLAGNFSDSANFDFTYDNVAPATLLDEDVSLQVDTGIYAHDRYTSALSLNDIRARFLNDHDETSVVALGQWVTGQDALHPEDFAVTPSAPLADGRYTLVALQTDRSGNMSDPLFLDYVLDTVAPDLKVVHGFREFNGRALPLLDYDTSSDSLLEWVQYCMVDASLPIAQQNTDAWRDVNRVEKSGAYDMYYRSIDRAGNASQAQLAGQVTVDMDAPKLQSPNVDGVSWQGSASLLSWLADNFSVQSEPAVHPQIAYSSGPSGEPVALSDYFVTATDLSGNVASPWAISKFRDDVIRVELQVANSAGFLLQTNENQATEFSGGSIDQSLIALGSDLSDKVSKFGVGDIFIGLGGGDLTVIDPLLELTGLSFLNEAETQFLADTFSGFLTEDREQRIFSAPILKAYLESAEDPGAGGISIFQSQFASYKSAGATEYLSTKWNPFLNKWFVDLGSNDDSVYFGGDAMNVLGGAGSDVLQGGGGDDYLVAGSNSEGGGDVLRGFGGNDVLVGGDHYFLSHVNVLLEGGSGDDTLIVGNGRSLLKGDAGADLFVIAPIDNSSAPFQVEIADFAYGTDLLQFVGLKSEDTMKGIFVNHDDGNVVIDLTVLFGPDRAPFGSTLTLSGLETDSLLPEDIVAGWFDFSASESFQWSDLALDTVVWT